MSARCACLSTARVGCGPIGCRGSTGPSIVCLQAGNVNTGAFDPIAEIAEQAHRDGAWVHVDGAFGLWAQATPAAAPPVRWHRAGRLLGHRCAQVAQRPV
ncbi:MAG: aminotransferase class V-fold PLP-dependent enzyme [Burkholderiaceae bacterium]